MPIRMSRTIALLCLALAACRVDVEPPKNVLIRCDDNDECPTGSSCRTGVGRCVEDGAETQAPRLVGAALIEPGLLPAGETAIVSFTVDEALEEPPVVELGTTPPRALTLDSADGRDFVFAYTAVGDEPETSLAVTARLLDTLGNEAVDVALGSLSFDFTPPGLLGFELLGPAGVVLGPPPGDVGQVRLTFDEALAEPPSVTLVDGPALTLESAEPPVYLYELTAGAGLGSGPTELDLHFEDVAGNLMELHKDAFVLDFTGPELVAEEVTRSPFYAPARSEGVLSLSYVDPRTAEPVKIVVTLTAGEALSPGVTLTAVQGAVELAFSVIEVTGNRAELEYELAGNEPGGAYDLEVAWQDARGNAAATTLSHSLLVDATPLAATAFDDTLITHWRRPHGTLLDPTPVARVLGQPGALTGAVEVLAYSSPLASPDHLLASRVPGEPGGFTLDLPGAFDLTRVYLVAVEASGARSEIFAVRNVLWTAALGDKQAGDDLTNPHRFEERPVLEARLVEPVAIELGSEDGIGLDASVDAKDRTRRWRPSFRRGPTSIEEPTSSHGSIVYDAGRGVLVFWDSLAARIYEWDGDEWHDVIVADPEGDGSLPTVGTVLGAYDPVRGTPVFVSQSGGNSRTWAWNGRSFRRLSSSFPWTLGGWPQLVADAKRGVLVLIDGAKIAEWSDGAWTQRCTTSPCADLQPAGRGASCAAFDLRFGRTVVFGGRAAGDGLEPETWSWDGAAWTPLPGAGPWVEPTPRTFCAMAYDRFRERIVLYGGRVGAAYSTEVHELDNVTWIPKAISDPESDGNPQQRDYPSLTYDGARNRVVLFGGMPVSGNSTCDGFAAAAYTCNRLWEWRATSWMARFAGGAGAGVPPESSLFAMAYDGGGKRIVMAGGHRSAGSSGTQQYYANLDTWTWRGAGWRKDAATLPGNRVLAGMAYAADRGAVIMAGGLAPVADPGESYGVCCHASTPTSYAWNGSAWNAVTTTTTPSLQYGPSSVLDSRPLALARDNLGGLTALSTATFSTWRLSASNWTQPGPTDSPSTSYKVMAYDTRRGLTVAFGAYPAAGLQLYELDADANAWTTRCNCSGASCEGIAACQTPARYAHAMAYDNGRGRILVYGGAGQGDVALGDFWSWDGDVWTELELTDREGDGSPGRIFNAAMAYDALRDELVLFGGETAPYAGDVSAFLDETWIMPSGHDERPGHVFVVAAGSAGLTGEEILESVNAIWIAGGHGTLDGETANGAKLLVWDGGGWEFAAGNSAGEDDPAPIGWSTATDPRLAEASADELERLFVGPRHELVLAVVPEANGDGPDDAVLSTDAVEVTIRYRLP